MTDAGFVSRGEWILATRRKSSKVLAWVVKLPESHQQVRNGRLIHRMDLFRVIAVRQGGHCGHSAHAAVAELDLHPADAAVDGPAMRKR